MERQKLTRKAWWLCGMLGLGVLMVGQVAFAQGKCTGEQMDKMMQGGFTKEEILQLCGTPEGQQAPQPQADVNANEQTPNADPQPLGGGNQPGKVVNQKQDEDLKAALVGVWQCQRPNNTVSEIYINPDGTFNQYDTISLYGMSSTTQYWGTYTAQSRGGNKGSITSTVTGSNSGGYTSEYTHPAQVILLTMPDRDTLELAGIGTCKRMQ